MPEIIFKYLLIFSYIIIITCSYKTIGKKVNSEYFWLRTIFGEYLFPLFSSFKLYKIYLYIYF